jgi:DNA-directed RNA polymerase specialized sigma subunit
MILIIHHLSQRKKQQQQEKRRELIKQNLLLVRTSVEHFLNETFTCKKSWFDYFFSFVY